MRDFGLIGKSLGHSFSQRYFTQKFAQEGRFDCRYSLYELSDISEFKKLVQTHPDLIGLNITIPYKQTIIPLLDEVDVEAARVGAVNTVRIFRDGNVTHTVGFNTDVEGFRLSLAGHHIPTRALILGTGGAAAAVMHVLHDWDIDCQQVSRTKNIGMIGYSELTPAIVTATELIINCTPLGMFPNVDAKPNLPYEAITNRHFLYDLVYNPEETSFLREGKTRGAQIQNGLRMLTLQADASWKIWNEAKRKVCP